MALPPVLFLALALLFWQGMGRSGQGNLPSVFIDRPAPPLPQERLGDYALLADSDLRSGQVTVVNFWASWCPPCRAEHPVLQEMAARGLRVAGVNVTDKQADALAYLSERGNPFFALAADPSGRDRVEWGVSGMPETFIVAGDGTVLFRFAGPLLGTDYEARFLPALEKALN
mgnify:CR=1 FL=1